MSLFVRNSVTLRFANALKRHAPTFSILALLTGCALPINTANPAVTQQLDYNAPLQPALASSVGLASAETQSSNAATISLDRKIYHVACAPEGTKIIATDKTIVSHGSKAGDPTACLSERLADGAKAEPLYGIFTGLTIGRSEAAEAVRKVVSQEVSKAGFHMEIPAGMSDQTVENIGFSTLNINNKSIPVLGIDLKAFNGMDRRRDGSLLKHDKDGEAILYFPVFDDTIYTFIVKKVINNDPGGWTSLIPIDVLLQLPVSSSPIKTSLDKN